MTDPSRPGEGDTEDCPSRTSIGSLRGRLDLSGDWDSPETNAGIADEFGVVP